MKTLTRLLMVAGILLQCCSVAAWAQPGWSTPVNIDDSHERFSSSPNVVIDSNDKIHAAWMDFNDDRIIRYATNMSGSWVKTTVQTHGGTPCLVLTPDQTLYLFYDHGSDPTHCYVRSKPVGSGSWSAAMQLTPGDGGNMGWADVDASGGVYFVWTKIRFDPNHGENYGRYKPLGGAWGPTELISSSGHGWPSGNFVSAHGNRFYICYYTSDNKPWVKVRNDGVFGPQRTIASAGSDPRVVENPVTGALEAVYHYDWGNWFAQSWDGGANWTGHMRLSTGSYLDRTPVPIADPNGNLHVLWQKIHREGTGAMCYYRERINGAWQSEYELTPWSLRTAGPSSGSLTTSTDGVHVYIHALPIADYFPDDFGDAVYLYKTESYVPPGPSGLLTGTVRDQFGQPVTNAIVVTTPSAYTAVTDSNGGYVINVLPVGTYSVNASKQYFTGQTLNNVTIQQNQTTTRDFAITGQAPADMISFTAEGENQYIDLECEKPSSGNFSGTMIRYKTTGYPTGPADGTLVLDRAGGPYGVEMYQHTGLTNGTPYYYTAFSYFADASRYYSAGIHATAIPAGPCDFDRDGDVDQGDFGEFQACLTGDFNPQPEPACGGALLDNDNDVDADDMTLFIGCISGPGNLANPSCLQ